MTFNRHDLEYLARALQRLSDECVEVSQKEHATITSSNAGAGRHQSGSTVLQIAGARERAFATFTRRMLGATFEAVGNVREADDVLLNAATDLRSRLQSDLNGFFAKQRWAQNLEPRIVEEFRRRTDATIESILDDYRHGMLGGVRFVRDPIVAVTTSVTNSPGAVVSSGFGNIQRDISTRSNEIRSAISAFVNSAEVQALPPGQRQSLIDVTEVIEGELDKRDPDTAKLGRWARRLQEIAERVGVAVAAEAVLRVLLGG